LPKIHAKIQGGILQESTFQEKNAEGETSGGGATTGSVALVGPLGRVPLGFGFSGGMGVEEAREEISEEDRGNGRDCAASSKSAEAGGVGVVIIAPRIGGAESVLVLIVNDREEEDESKLVSSISSSFWFSSESISPSRLLSKRGDEVGCSSVG
jgi:hypothetical protein